MIEEYRFGLIKVSGETYTHDVEVRWFPESSSGSDSAGFGLEVLPWWRKESHLIDSIDIQRALTQKPDILIIGTGMYGMAKITGKAQEEIRIRGVKLIIDKTEEAVKAFNVIKAKIEEEGEKKKIIGLFHLTC